MDSSPYALDIEVLDRYVRASIEGSGFLLDNLTEALSNKGLK